MLAGPSMPPSVPVGLLPVEAAFDIQTPSEPDEAPAHPKLEALYDDHDATMRLLAPLAGPSRSWTTPSPGWAVIEGISRPASSADGTGVAKVKRAKRGTTCLRCKRQKTRCDGLMPCAICVTHGEQANCTYRSGYHPPSASSASSAAAVAALVRRSASPNDEIVQVSREELVRLRSTLDKFQAIIRDHAELQSSPFALASSLRDVKIQVQPLALEIDCIAGAFGRMFHKPDWGEYCREGERSPLVALGKRRLLTPAAHEPFEWTEQAPILDPVPDPTTPHDRVAFVLGLMPTATQAASLSKFFFAKYNWILFPVQPQAFLSSCQHHFAHPHTPGLDPPDWAWNAVVLAVCRIGLAGLDDESAAGLELTDPAARLAIGDLWLRAALIALELADSEANPTLEAFRAMILIIFGFVFLGESSDAGAVRSLMTLHRRAVQMALVLRLHRDPTHLKTTPPLSESEQADRRCLWWTLKVLGCVLANASGVFSTILPDRLGDVALPREPAPSTPGVTVACLCGGQCSPWNPTMGLRARYMLTGQLVSLISTLEFKTNPPPTYQDLMDLHRRMLAVVGELPDHLRLRTRGCRVDVASISPCWLTAQTQISFFLHYHYLMLRLHRPVHTLVDVGAANVPFHRAITVQAARTLLDMRRIARVSHTNALAGTFFVAAAVSLAIDVLQLSPGPARATVEALEMRAEVEQLVAEFLDGAKMPVMQRGKRVLEFLLGQIDQCQAEVQEEDVVAADL